MNDPQMNDILARLNSVGGKPASSAAKSSNSAGDPAMHDILSRFHAVSGKYQVNEGLGAEQRKVGQLGPTDKPSKRKDHAFKGKLVGEDDTSRLAQLEKMRNPEAEANFAKTGTYGRDQSAKMHSGFFSMPDEFADPHKMIKGAMNMGMSAADVDAALPKGYSIPAAQAQKTSGFKIPFDQPASATNTATGFTPSSNKLFQDEFSEDVDGGVDTLTMGIPLFIRMLEYAREEAQTDADLHHVTKKMMDMGGNVTMDDYDEIMTSVGGEESEMDEAVGDKLTDLEYGSATATATPTVGGYHQRRDLETGSYTDYTDRGPVSTQTNYNKAGQMTSQHAQARVGDQTMARSRFYPKKNESEELRRLAGLATEDYVGGREAPQDLVKSLSKSYRDFVKEVEQQSAAKPDRELRSKKEKPRKFGNILGEE
jgi:YD repeat-containing protein